MIISDKFIKATNSLCELNASVAAPYIRKSFNLDFSPTIAEITICGLGFYELYINGIEITKGPLAPYISNPDHLCYYDNYDIADFLQPGENVIGIILGNGMRNAYGGYIWNFDKARFRGSPALALCLEAECGEKHLMIEADESFKVHPSPIIYDDLRMGYMYDSRMEIPDWFKPGFDDSNWDMALLEETPSGEKLLCNADPIAITEELLPVAVKKYDSHPFAYHDASPNAAPRKDCIRENVYVFDFGVNTAGLTKLKINGRCGQKITIRHGEMLQNGRFSIYSTCFLDRSEASDSAYLNRGQTDVFICKGGEEVFIPKFKYDGFRYAYVEGLDEEQIREDTLTCLVMNSKLSERASFSCSDEVLNKLWQCCRRSDLSNFYYFPTDCPHREKNGWTGDISMSAEHMLLTLTAEESLKEWLLNLRKAQTENGSFPGIVPTGDWGYDSYGPTWDGVCVTLPYYIYKFTGDIRVVLDNVNAILRFFDYITTCTDEKGLINVGLGDWVDPFRHYRPGKKIAAPLVVTESVMLYVLAKKAEHIFVQANLKNESERVREIGNNMRQLIREHLIDWDTFTVLGDCQTTQAFAIAVGVFEDSEKLFAEKRLVEIIHRDGDVNACGMIGLRYIFHVLTDMGECELAYKIITGKSRTCYGYWIENGATSMWESFRDLEGEHVDSRNHHFLGDISSWFVQKIAGLRPNPNASDIRHFEIAPHFLEKLSFAQAKYNSPYGAISVMWRRENDKIQLEISAPEGIYGDIILPKGKTFSDGDTKKTIEVSALCQYTII